jgi:transcriptional regulator with XRE-family HTH domain
MSWQEEVGQQIRQAREKAGLKQKDLGREVGRVGKTIMNYEAGSVTLPPDVLGKIAVRLQMSEIRINGFSFSITHRVESTAPAPSEQLRLDFDREHVFPNATIKISPTRISITITATASIRPAA